MAFWQPRTQLNNNAPDGGIIALYNTANVFEFNEWRTSGEYGIDIFYYFIIPAGFVYVSENKFLYNFPLKYVNKSEKVTGWVEHNGVRQLQEGKTDPFWHLEEAESYLVELQTSEYTRLPYLLVPDCGLTPFAEEKRYFIPLPETA